MKEYVVVKDTTKKGVYDILHRDVYTNLRHDNNWIARASRDTKAEAVELLKLIEHNKQNPGDSNPSIDDLRTTLSEALDLLSDKLPAYRVEQLEKALDKAIDYCVRKSIGGLTLKTNRLTDAKKILESI